MKIYNIKNNGTRQLVTIALIPIVLLVIFSCCIFDAILTYIAEDSQEVLKDAFECMKVRPVRYK